MGVPKQGRERGTLAMLSEAFARYLKPLYEAVTNRGEELEEEDFRRVRAAFTVVGSVPVMNVRLRDRMEQLLLVASPNCTPDEVRSHVDILASDLSEHERRTIVAVLEKVVAILAPLLFKAGLLALHPLAASEARMN